MNGFRYEDLFATKHLEYLLVIGFLFLLVLFWRFLQKPAHPALQAAGVPVPTVGGWFELPEGLYYHQGHSWAAPQDSLVRVGVDDFAQKMIGPVSAVEVPSVGSSLEQGGVGWRFHVGSKRIGMLCPVKGEVAEVNKKVFENPDIINQDPYGEGWVMRIRPRGKDAGLRNLLTEKLARAWTGLSVDALMERMSGEIGAVYQDGGAPIAGIARILDPDDWDTLIKEFLLTEEI